MLLCKAGLRINHSAIIKGADDRLHDDISSKKEKQEKPGLLRPDDASTSKADLGPAYYASSNPP